MFKIFRRPKTHARLSRAVDVSLVNSCFCICQSYSSLSNTTAKQDLPQSPLPPTFSKILRRMRWEKKSLNLNVRHGLKAKLDKIQQSLNELSYYDSRARISVGDLVNTRRYGPLVILEIDSLYEPNSALKYRACDMLGNVLEVPKSDILFRLGELVPESFQHLMDSCVSQITNGHSSTSRIADSSFTMSLDVRSAICPQIRNFQYLGDQIRIPILKCLNSVFHSFRTNQHPINLSLFTLAAKIQDMLYHGGPIEGISKTNSRYMDGFKATKNWQDQLEMKFTPNLELTSVSPHVLFTVHKLLSSVFDKMVLMDQRPSGVFLTILPRAYIADLEVSTRYIEDDFQAITDLKWSKNLNEASNDSLDEDPRSIVNPTKSQIVKSYGVGDINASNLVYQSMALSVMRHDTSLGDNTLQPADALKWSFGKETTGAKRAADLTRGPSFDAQRFSFIRNIGCLNNVKPIGSDMPDAVGSFRRTIGEPAYCIDDEHAEEIDDAVSIARAGSLYQVRVHIADPTSCFNDLDEFWHSPILNQAFQRTTTVYFPNAEANVPMLPKPWAQSFSLDTSRRCLTVSFSYDPKENKIVGSSVDVYPGWLNNVKQVTYNETDSILSGSSSDDLSDLQCLNTIASNLRQSRISSGAINLGLARAQYSSSEDRVTLSSMTPAKSMVAELMIAANHFISKWAYDKGIPFLYRSQQVDIPRDLRTQLNGLQSSGAVNLPSLPIPLSLQLLTYMRPSIVSTRFAAHESLGLPLYTHFSSPLRRFQDIAVHWQLHSILRPNVKRLDVKSLEAIAVHCQSSQLRVDECTRQAHLYSVLTSLKHNKPDIRETNIKGFVASPIYNSGLSKSCQNIYLPDLGITAQAYINESSAFDIGKQVTCVVENIDPIDLNMRVKLV